MNKQNKVMQAVEISSLLSQIKRTVGYTTTHRENDAEHSYQIALASWAANSQYELELNEEKIIKMALVHDLVEVYAGDIDSFASEEIRLQKIENEEKALGQMKENFPELNEIYKIIEEYESKQSLESKLINIIDKIIPVTHDFKTNSEYYKKRKITISKYEAWLYTKSEYALLPKKFQKIVDDTVNEVNTTYKHLFYIGVK